MVKKALDNCFYDIVEKFLKDLIKHFEEDSDEENFDSMPSLLNDPMNSKIDDEIFNPMNNKIIDDDDEISEPVQNNRRKRPKRLYIPGMYLGKMFERVKNTIQKEQS